MNLLKAPGLAVALVAFGLSVSAQTKKDSATAHFQPVQATDSTGLLTYKDFQELNTQIIQELPAKYANPIVQWLSQRIQLRAAEYVEKQKIKK